MKPPHSSESNVVNLITRQEILKGRDSEFPLTPELETNLSKLLLAINLFRRKYGKPMIINSGYRPGYYNTTAGGSPTSTHITCEAVDIRDIDRSLTNYILSHPSILVDCDLYMEEPAATPTWVHLQTRPTKSGRRIFIP